MAYVRGIILIYMEWDVPEHLYFEKTNDWYASVIIVAGALIALEFMFNQWLLIALTIVATAAIILVVSRKPEIMHVAITNTGVRAGHTFYPWASLDAFAVVEHPWENKIILESNHRFMPHIYIPIARGIDLGAVRAELLKHLAEKHITESPLHLLLERWGF